ncbi:MAG: hypothetical protein JWO09_33 [Bacteroidetes bacterium]|nr:hypothetical protein [Bacteroidota bacterium]
MLPKKHFFLFAFLLFIINTCTAQTGIDTLEFQPGYPLRSASALQQLESFPSPRYVPGNDLIRLFNWMNPLYMGGLGQKEIKKKDAIEAAYKIQEELILHWNYFLFIPNATYAFDANPFSDPNSPFGSYVKLANKYPEVPLGTTVFWMQLQPEKLGYKKKRPNILLQDLPDRFYVKDKTGAVVKKRINFAAPDSLFAEDGQMQKKCLQNLLDHLTRPIDLINENGEEPPGNMSESDVSGDADMIADKKKLGIGNWNIYMAVKKQHIRTVYSSQFMSLPALKKTWFTVYAVEGGPINRFDWNASKKTCSQIKGNYYSTPDFYPRHPNNWKLWQGAWHGWKWINDGRMNEIRSGDRFFSPFVAAGWDTNPEKDIRPGQWLGLLKCLSVVGAEFYYVAYFNLRQPFTKPENYVWQAAIPAYAQAVTTHYREIFRNGNVLMDEKGNPVVTYPVNDKDVLVAVRKHDQKQQYIIAATLQPSSNTERFATDKPVEIKIDGETIRIKARRQGSVYFFDKSAKPYVFYQLDRWHQYEHPSRWRKEMIFEAEVPDTSSAGIIINTIYDKAATPPSFTYSESVVILQKDQWLGYMIDQRDLEHNAGDVYIKLFVRSRNRQGGSVELEGWKKDFTAAAENKWQWIFIKLEKEMNVKAALLKVTSQGELEIDKMALGRGMNPPDLKEY